MIQSIDKKVSSLFHMFLLHIFVELKLSSNVKISKGDVKYYWTTGRALQKQSKY